MGKHIKLLLSGEKKGGGMTTKIKTYFTNIGKSFETFYNTFCPPQRIISIFKADLVAFNKEILQISEIKDLQPATTIPCCRANEAR